VRAFLDGSQYSAASILRYERMFGKGFVSTGGLATTQASDAPAPCSCLDQMRTAVKHFHMSDVATHTPHSHWTATHGLIGLQHTASL
jgi:hypothetical protein